MAGFPHAVIFSHATCVRFEHTNNHTNQEHAYLKISILILLVNNFKSLSSKEQETASVLWLLHGTSAHKGKILDDHVFQLNSLHAAGTAVMQRNYYQGASYLFDDNVYLSS